MTDTPLLTSAELADLKAKAQAATPGEWRLGGLITNQEGEIGFVNAGAALSRARALLASRPKQ